MAKHCNKERLYLATDGSSKDEVGAMGFAVQDLGASLLSGTTTRTYRWRWKRSTDCVRQRLGWWLVPGNELRYTDPSWWGTESSGASLTAWLRPSALPQKDCEDLEALSTDDDLARRLELPSPIPESEYEFKGHKLVFEAAGADRNLVLASLAGGGSNWHFNAGKTSTKITTVVGVASCGPRGHMGLELRVL